MTYSRANGQKSIPNIKTSFHQGYLAIYMKMARVKEIERQKMFDFIIHVAT